jgi:phosphatidylethanolamine-binding protein (PEBP) family uncharacterized protein
MLTRHLVFATMLCVSAAAFGQSGLSLDWQWKKSHECSKVSPAFLVSGLPEGTKTIEIDMVDLDAPNYDHGGGSVPHAGGPTATIADGALKNYRGPCPPNFASFGHDYQFTVRALAADGKTVLEKASRTKTFSAKTAK